MKKTTRKKTSARSTIRRSLLEKSSLQSAVLNGIGAIEKGHRGYIDEDVRASFDDSLEVDDNLRSGREGENRWDYLLGHEESGKVIGLEPHTADNHEVTTVIKKRQRALEQLRPHWRDGRGVAAWFWVASKDVGFLPLEKKVLQLANNGIAFVGKRLLAKHLAKLSST